MIKTAIVIAFLLNANTIHAYECFRNPDRFISVGFKVENYRTSGDYTAISAPNYPALIVDRGEAQRDYVGVGVNVRVPTSENLTLDLDYMGIDGEDRFSRSNNAYSEHSKMNGYRTSVGLRLYLN